MDIEKYIASGVLELYLSGTLSEDENWDVYQNAIKYPKIKEELWSIEAAIFEVSKSVFPEISLERGFNDLKNRIGKSEVDQVSKKAINWSIFGSRVAAALLAIGLLWFAYRASQLESDLNTIDQQNQVLHYQIAELRDSLVKSNELLYLLKDKNMLVVPLKGQAVSPVSKATVYWDKEAKKLYVDAQGLPDQPKGFVYQVWSHALDPLPPKSVGLLPDFLAGKHKIFVLENPSGYDSEAFGITLEPEGGSETPTADKLYALGTVPSPS